MALLSLWYLTPRYNTLSSFSSGARLRPSPSPSPSPQHITPPRIRIRYIANHGPWHADSVTFQHTDPGYHYHKPSQEFYYPLGPIPSNVYVLVPLSQRLLQFRQRIPFYGSGLNEDHTAVRDLSGRVVEGGKTIQKAIDFYTEDQDEPADEVGQIDSMLAQLHSALTANKLLLRLSPELCLSHKNFSIMATFTRHLVYRNMMLRKLTEHPKSPFTGEENIAMEAAFAKAKEITRQAPKKGPTLRVLVRKLYRLDAATTRLIECKREIRSLNGNIEFVQRALCDARSQDPMDEPEGTVDEESTSSNPVASSPKPHTPGPNSFTLEEYLGRKVNLFGESFRESQTDILQDLTRQPSQETPLSHGRPTPQKPRPTPAPPTKQATVKREKLQQHQE